MNHKGIWILLLSLFINKPFAAQTPVKLVSQQVNLKKGLSFSLKVPQGYSLAVTAEGLERPRFFALSPDGRLFITDMHDRSDNHSGRVLVLENPDPVTHAFQKITVYKDSLHNPNQVAFYSRNGKQYIYIAETGKLSYYTYTPGDSRPSSPPTVIARFPDYGLSYKYGGWHLTRSLAFHQDKLYVSVGSSCDACLEKEEVRATILEMDPDGSHSRIYARGIRNAVGLQWVEGKLWITHMGRDNRGPDKPEELFQPVNNGGFYGWPYYYQYHKKIIADTAFSRLTKPAYAVIPPVAPYSFKAHSAPLGFRFFTGFRDSLLNHSFLVALHGSTSVWRQRGNAVVQVMPNGSTREIITGFLQGTTENKRYGRPCDIIQADAQSFYVSDDKNGVIYYIRKDN